MSSPNSNQNSNSNPSMPPSSDASLPAHSNSGTAAIVAGVVVTIVVLIGIAGAVFWYTRRRSRHTQAVGVDPKQQKAFRRRTFVDPTHIACHVTPFSPNSGEETPRFVHQPGTNMRVAHRREDGGWEFHDLTPDTMSTLDFAPPRTSFSARSTLSFSSNYLSSKEKMKLQPGELTTRGYVEHAPADLYVDGEDVPPPAYCPSDPGHGSDAHV
ncbi:hypothetical protein WOLCODRAFT_27946 [Wolfiporia cocos MD-104 SS10]|uniref:Uncharacterized protein n=1 Tax=Wolfiporia cocos (strain MD-104) TaxID=742152 RepID=A0A2H3IZV6_WOLCO|nr:hypothetical protein WOLCODRAFT_27946 [Wolfiporia cocos MD-104 SS10]